MIQMNGSVQDLKGKIANHEQTLNTKEHEMKSIEESWSANFEENLTVTYRENVMATVDGITTFVCTFGDEWKKYDNGKICIGELVEVVTKETVIATARGLVLD
jgi:uncharacterized protein (DUF1015 family)